MEIVSPVCARKEQDGTDRLGPEDFPLDPLTHTVTACPAGLVLLEGLYLTTKEHRLGCGGRIKRWPSSATAC
ncbi:MAG: hypothetical protein ACKV2Q_05535 [Planctomycetaceae bacterium]